MSTGRKGLGGIGVEGVELRFAVSAEGVHLTGRTIAGGEITISPSSARFIASQLAIAAREHATITAHVEGDEAALLEKERSAMAALDAASEAEHDALEKWNAARLALEEARRKRAPKEHELTYAFERCPCGAHLAYWGGSGARAWDCADVLLGRVGTPEDKALVGEASPFSTLPPKEHAGKIVHRSFPFAFWKMKTDPSRKTARDMVTITVNTKPHQVPAGPLTYETIIALAGHQPGAVVSVVYEAPGGRDGILSHGRQVEACEGLRVSAYVTGYA